MPFPEVLVQKFGIAYFVATDQYFSRYATKSPPLGVEWKKRMWECNKRKNDNKMK